MYEGVTYDEGYYGGAIYSRAELVSDNDIVKNNTAKTADDINLCIALLVIGIIGISLTIYLNKLAIKNSL